MHAKPANTPLPTGLFLQTEEGELLEDSSQYMRLIG